MNILKTTALTLALTALLSASEEQKNNLNDEDNFQDFRDSLNPEDVRDLESVTDDEDVDDQIPVTISPVYVYFNGIRYIQFMYNGELINTPAPFYDTQ
jgi:hypothetical protein